MKPSTPPVLITLALVCFALVQNTQPVVPPQNGGYPGGNTTEGQNALLATAHPQGLMHEGLSHFHAQVRRSNGGVQEAWVARYNGPGNAYDFAFIIAVSASGNAYVTGGSIGSGTDYDYATVKYDSPGQEQWVARYNGPGNGGDNAYGIAVDVSDNVYVTGTSFGSGGYDYATVKYNSSGHEQWVTRYNGPGNDYDEADAIAVDASGNVYVTGRSIGSGSSEDYATVKYNSSGQEQWAARYNGPANDADRALSIAVDASGNVYVTGQSTGSGTGYDYATVKYNSSGQELWVARYNGPANGVDSTYAIAVDRSDNVYVTGRSMGSGTGLDYATVKYNSSGQELWVDRYNGPGNGVDEAYAIAIDASDNVYVTGRSIGSDTGYDYATVKYNSSGQEQWAARYNGPGNGADEAYAIAIDASDNVYVTGRSTGSGTGYDYATVKYNGSGQEQWAARYDGPGNDVDIASVIVLDGVGNVYVTGGSVGSGTDFDYATIKYFESPSPTPAPTPRSTPTPRPRPTPAPRP